MSLLCGCIKLDAITPVITVEGGAEGVWTAVGPKEAEFVATHLAGPPCGVTDNSSMRAECRIKANGCGTLKITVQGRGSRYWPYPDIFVNRLTNFLGVIQMRGEGGFHTGCDDSALVDIDEQNGATVRMCCGQVLFLAANSLYNEHTPALEITFKVEVVVD